METVFEQWCGDVRAQYEARHFSLDMSDYDELAILAHHTLNLDDVKRGRGNFYNRYLG